MLHKLFCQIIMIIIYNPLLSTSVDANPFVGQSEMTVLPDKGRDIM